MTTTNKGLSRRTLALLLAIVALLAILQPPLWPARRRKPVTQDYDPENRHFNTEQCLTRFPELYKEADRARDYYRRRGGISLASVEAADQDTPNSHARVIIFENRVYIKSYRSGINSRVQAALAAIYATVLTSPEPLPNIDIVLHVDDGGGGSHPHLALCRQESSEAIWLMPDFGFFSWPEPGVGAYTEVRDDTLQYELASDTLGNSTEWLGRKIPKLIWRGAAMVEVRHDLLRASAGQPWSDVRELNWGAVQDHRGKSNDGDLKTIVDHCKYAFLAHTEGHTYSGRLKYLQQCHSVIVAHRLGWIQHYHHLLDGRFGSINQNFVEVPLPFEDNLAGVMDRLLDPNNAEMVTKIAHNSWQDLRQRYISPAANECYYRYLLRAYADVMTFEPSIKGAVPYESFILTGSLHWEPH